MNLNQIRIVLYSIYLTNSYGFRLKKEKDHKVKKQMRADFGKQLFKRLNISIKVTNPEMMPNDGQFLLACNHISVLDPIVVEVALEKTNIYGHWIAKKELYNSILFGTFTRNAGTILLDRDAKQMGGFFADVKACVKEGLSIYMFPE